MARPGRKRISFLGIIVAIINIGIDSSSTKRSRKTYSFLSSILCLLKKKSL
jgi:hypothetical protein